MQPIFPHHDAIAALLQTSLPACRDGCARIEGCAPLEVVTGRRGKVFALAGAMVSAAGAAPTLRRFVIHAYPPGGGEEARKVFRRIRRMAREQGTAGALSPWSFLLPERRWLVVPFPFDYRLPHLGQVCEPAVVSDGLRAVGVEADVAAITPVRYVPEKRCQVRLEVSVAGAMRRVWFAKTMAAGNGAEVVRAMQRLHVHFAGSQIAGTPAPVAYLEPWQAVVQQGVPGETLYDLQRGGEVAAEVYRRTGAALAELHRAPLPDLPIHGRSEERSLLAAMLEKGVLAPSEQARAAVLLDALDDTPAGVCEAGWGTSHRDFYDKQVLIDNGRLWIIDLDTLAHAPRALDVGNFVAHLRLRTRQGYLDGASERRARLAFVGGYGATCTDAGLAWWTASALVRLAVIYAVRPAWRHLASGLLRDASAVLAGHDVFAPDLASMADEVRA
ncbi:MAG: aminoglycoside phosphotransferase family protein [Vicinamibacterales bacterium]